ncbi:DUF924 family protein [Microbulbifer aggregans]|uniref:DUF924 family protein n=1 Tax=Microbulbifer aggregans TaxID=1769779 RepID=UPI001CFD64B6|nr:DUF924 family protein [Microbulbifer aggregans]
MNDSTKISTAMVLTFWFGDTALDHAVAATLRQRWFRGGSAFDEAIRRRFAHTVAAALTTGLPHWQENLEGRLALILLCDQFTRNIFRGSARAFAGDQTALATCQALISTEDLSELGLHQRAFVGMPLEHTESSDIQARSVAYFEQLRADFQGHPESQLAQNYYHYAVQHRDVINTFGRFPHRNHALGRKSTTEEQRWLDAGGGF